VYIPKCIWRDHDSSLENFKTGLQRDGIYTVDITDQCIVEEQQLSSYYGEVRKESNQRAQTVQPVEQQVAADLAKVRERDGVEIAGLGVLDEDDRQVALDHRAVAENAQVAHVTGYTH